MSDHETDDKSLAGTPRTESKAQEVRAMLAESPTSNEKLRIGNQMYYELARQLERELAALRENYEYQRQRADHFASRPSSIAAPTDDEISKTLYAYEGALSEQDDDQDGLTTARNNLVALMRRLRQAAHPVRNRTAQ